MWLNDAKRKMKSVFLTETVAVCVPLKAHSTLGFRVASERALCIHTLKAGATVMALLHTLIDVWDGERGKKCAQCQVPPLDGSVVKGELARESQSSLYLKEEKKRK